MNIFELGLLNFIQNHLRNPVLDVMFSYVTRLGDGGIFWIALSLLLIIFKRTRKIGITMALSILIGFVVGNLLLKNIFARTRPYDINTEIQLLVGKPHDFSFPSGHTLVSVESAVSVFLYNKRWGTAAIITAALVALSRLYLYMHYPTDVLFGAILGVLTAFAAFIATNKIYSKRKKDIKKI